MAVIKIAQRGDDPGGLIRYLFGKGKNNEHVNQRTITGTTHAHSGPWDRQSIQQISQDLRAFSQANPQSRIGAEHKHIWHASISLPPGETLTDKGWQRLAQEYMQGMGFEDSAKAPIRWTAVHHGRSSQGNDHIHIVMSMIRQDGSKVRIHDDAKRSRAVLTGIEQRHNLTVLQPRPNAARPITYKAGERGKAQQTGNPIERQDLERRVRALATGSRTEAEFVRRLRAAGLTVYARPGGADGTAVTGYAVGFPNGVHFKGSALARDLSLPRLRLLWNEDRHGLEAAAAEWLKGSPGNPLVKYGRETKKNTPLPGDVKRELADAHFRLATAEATDFPGLSSDLAGALALAGEHDPALIPLSREVGRSAQTTSYPRSGQRTGFLNLGLLMLALQDKDPRTREMLMIRQVVAMLATLVQTHRARASALNQGRSPAMSQPDATDELTEMGVNTGITLGAAAVQLALQKLQHARAVQPAPGEPKNKPKQQEEPVREATPDLTKLHADAARKMEVLGIDPAQRERLQRLDPQELSGLVDRLSETIAETPGAVDREDLLFIAEVENKPELRDWALLASNQEVAAEVSRLTVPDTQQAASVRIPNWRTGGEAMTPNQRWALDQFCRKNGLDPHKDLTVTTGDGITVRFQDFTKAQASGAISEFKRLEREKELQPVGSGAPSQQSRQAQQTITNAAMAAPSVNEILGALNMQTPPVPNKNQGRSGRG